MKLVKVLWFAIICCMSVFGFCQTEPNLETGFKPYGSYHGTDIDTVSLMSGNVTLHVPYPYSFPQRGTHLDNRLFMIMNSKTWEPKTVTHQDGTSQVTATYWTAGNSGLIDILMGGFSGETLIPNLIRNVNTTTSNGVTHSAVTSMAVKTWDGASHYMFDTSGNGTAYETADASGWHANLTNPDSNGIPQAGVLIYRDGTQYAITNFSSLCSGTSLFSVPSGGGSQYHPILPTVSGSIQLCGERAQLNTATDTNGNVVNLAVFDPNTGVSSGIDTMGRNISFFGMQDGLSSSNSTDSLGCFTAGTFTGTNIINYVGPNGIANQLKICMSTFTTQTNFGVSGIIECPSGECPGAPGPGITTLLLGDKSSWSFDYDGYGNVTFVGLPLGGSISYLWATVAFPPTSGTPVSRAVVQRTLTDNHGNSYVWKYHWLTAQSNPISTNGTFTNVVTDPLNNDSVHVFTNLQGQFFETRTQFYTGPYTAGHLVKQIDTTYQLSTQSPGGVTSALPTDIQTTLFPSGKVSLTHRDYDSGISITCSSCNATASYGKVVSEKEYDWGQGSHGSLLRETDTTYQWQSDSRYKDAYMLDLPATVVIKDGGGCALSETDYTYDEAAYFTGTTVSTQHVAAPNPTPVRGNLSTVTRWLAPTSSCNPKSGTAVTSNTNWYDTGEVYQQVDPLGHPTTHSYDNAYVGAFPTKTCNAVGQCVSATYDFTTGVITSFTNVNATAQASGNIPGDSAHTTSYGYDLMSRLKSASFPPDPSNGGTQAQTIFNYPNPITFPFTINRTKSIAPGLEDSFTSTLDGLGRTYKTEHSLSGGTATVDTVFDGLDHPATVSNPYFSSSDPTYGTTTDLYDALGRVYQTIKQDGSVSKAAYSVQTTVAVNGDCTQTTDEAGNQRGACSDALGRLVEVDEPNSANPVQVNYLATLLTDGNFVLENAAGTGIWSTGTYGTNATSIYMQDDGNLVLYIFKWQAGTYATPSPGPFPPASCSIGSYLMVNQRLNANQCIASPHGQYMLYMASDGNFYIYDQAHNTGTWGPGTYGHPGAYAIMQGDGNFCVYDANNVYLWCSGTSGTNADRLNMEDDGRIIIYKSAWNSGTSDGQFYGNVIAHPSCDVGNSGLGSTGVLGSGSCLVSPNGRFELLMQGDGNLVIYDRAVTPNVVLWSTGTAISQADPGFAMRTLYSYDALGNLLRVEQHGDTTDSTKWRTRTFTYDTLSRLLTATNPESGTISYSYDADGNMITKTDARGIMVSYIYDALHRLVTKSYSDGSPSSQYLYDNVAWWPSTNAIGRLVEIYNGASESEYFNYDALGRVVSETRYWTNGGGTVNAGYDLAGDLTQLTYPNGEVVTYTPDSAGRIVSAVDNGNGINFVTGATYGPDSALTRFVSGSGGPTEITNSFSYNKRLQPLTMSASSPSQTVFSIGYDFHLGAGDNGNVFGITNYKDNTRNQTFTYDALNRLTSAQNAGTNCAATTVNGKTEYWGNSYGYDAWGNLLQKSVTKCSAENFSVAALANNQLSGYSYDAAGNMTNDGLGHAFTLDAESRIAQVNSGAVNYAYDGDGNRARKDVSGQPSTEYFYFGGSIIAEFNTTSGWTNYVFFDGDRVARKDSTGVSYYFSDHLKTASVITDSAGNIKSESDFYPWGGELQFVNNDSNHYKFTGKERDTETQLDYFGARYYSNGLGRFVTPDWSAAPVPVPYADLEDPQSLNQYSYVRNLPTSKVDADGHDGGVGVVEKAIEYSEKGLAELVDSAEGALAEAGGAETVVGSSRWGLLAGPAIYIGAMLHPASVGQSDSDERAQIQQASQERAAQNGGVDPQQAPEPQTSTSGAGARKGGGPKAADAPGVTAGGQATDKYGNKKAPSGENQINKTRSNTREKAKNKALNQGSGVEEHRTPRRGRRHFHSTRANGKKVRNNPHHEF